MTAKFGMLQDPIPVLIDTSSRCRPGTPIREAVEKPLALMENWEIMVSSVVHVYL